MKNKYIAYLLFSVTMILSSQIMAQGGLVIAGGYLNQSGGQLIIHGGVTNSGNLNAGNGTIKLTNDWINNGTFNSDAGSVELNGTVAVNIGGSNPNSFNNIAINNTNGILLAANVTVNGNLDFQNGIVTTGANTLTMGSSGMITNPSGIKYVNGKLAQTFLMGGTKLFPIGKGGNYRPLTFRYLGVQGPSVVYAEQFESPIGGTLPSGFSLLTTGRHWTISQSGGINFMYYVTLDPTDYTPSKPVVLLKNDGGNISYFSCTTPNYTNKTGLTSFSDFALGQVNAAYNENTGIYYASLQEAIDAALDGQTVDYLIPVDIFGGILYDRPGIHVNVKNLSGAQLSIHGNQ